jgi:hypothetical protein
LLAPHPTTKLEDHLLLAFHACLFNVFTATLHTWSLIFHLKPEDAHNMGDLLHFPKHNYIVATFYQPILVILLLYYERKYGGLSQAYTISRIHCIEIFQICIVLTCYLNICALIFGVHQVCVMSKCQHSQLWYFSNKEQTPQNNKLLNFARNFIHKMVKSCLLVILPVTNYKAWHSVNMYELLR